MGVRYNAEKRKVGNYYSTPIYAFRCKCHLCDGWFEIQTDPKVRMQNMSLGLVLMIFICRILVMLSCPVRGKKSKNGIQQRMVDMPSMVSILSLLCPLSTYLSSDQMMTRQRPALRTRS